MAICKYLWRCSCPLALSSGKLSGREWRLYLADQGLAEGTIRKRCNNAKQFFRVATRKNLIPSNPFIDLKSAAISNRSRDYFISREEAQRVLDACPDLQWRTIFALSRFGGFRCPTEHVALRWDGIDWGGSSGDGSGAKMLVHSPKTEHFQGGESRWVPIFPELRSYLEEMFEQAKPGAEYVITRYRDPNVNLRTQMLKIISRAGLKPWPKLFQNLRATRETELAEKFPIHVVCAWIGNTPKVAKDSYLQVTDDHFAKAAQNPAQHLHESPRTESQSEKSDMKKAPAMQELAGDCSLVQSHQVGPTGVEPARPYGHMPLKHARLPIPPRAHSLPKTSSRQSIESTHEGLRVKSREPENANPSGSRHSTLDSPLQIGSPPHSRRSRSRR